MFRGIYTAANAMLTKQNRIETISNNIANVDTTGFKKDVDVIEAFSEKLLYKRENNEGYLRAFPNRAKVSNKQLRDGNTKIDIDITRGYLQLEDKNGNSYHKSASLVRDEEGYLRTVYREYNSDVITKFGAYLLDVDGNKINAPQGEIAIDSLGNLTAGGTAVAKVIIPEARKSIGTINSGALRDRVMINFNQGSQERTENPMHISLEGEGFFKIRINGTDSIKYSRSGAFTMDENRVIKDYLNNTVLSEDNNQITVPENSKSVEFKRDGSVYSLNNDGQREQIGKLALVDITNKEDMQKYGHSYMQMIGNTQPQEKAFEGKVLQGYLERSNVNTIDEMVDMIEMFRGFESDQKVINSYDQIMQKAANEIGKI
ncbi:flagella basal body rod protein [Peptoanaerobacter stomatis]|jgi:flagellar basal body and hook protein|uniref:Flagella basal body rod protein n=1 Tax=Peptoanaerobacter stomatis TaxID=796937 RepID=J6H728_9FIRM|nr:flagellar hook-basal body protein [Peptoanaerobacter stomatis]EJU21050.1 flagella basal body rod protein [Peptoanaerobacter stomatis]NWO25385.1 flagellar hook-basal body protein [Peptostreptococcaceae bacterium oral taxon 081]